MLAAKKGAASNESRLINRASSSNPSSPAHLAPAPHQRERERETTRRVIRSERESVHTRCDERDFSPACHLRFSPGATLSRPCRTLLQAAPSLHTTIASSLPVG